MSETKTKGNQIIEANWHCVGPIFKAAGEFEYRGVLYCGMHKGIDIDMMKEWKVKSSDVLVATPAKSGTTWMGEILQQMRQHHPEFKSDVEEISYVPYAEMGSPFTAKAVDCMDKMSSPRVIKTHLYYEFFQEKVEQEGLKVVVVLREPKDALTSFFHLYCSKKLGFTGDFHKFFELFRKERLFYGNIIKMSTDWWMKRHLPNVHVVRYEEMKKDCAEVVRNLSSFLGIPLEDKSVDDIVEKCSFETMRKTSTMGELKDEHGESIVEVDKFFRKGIVGDWKNHMTQEEQEFVDNCVRENYDPYGLNFNV